MELDEAKAGAKLIGTAIAEMASVCKSLADCLGVQVARLRRIATLIPACPSDVVDVLLEAGEPGLLESIEQMIESAAVAVEFATAAKGLRAILAGLSFVHEGADGRRPAVAPERSDLLVAAAGVARMLDRLGQHKRITTGGLESLAAMLDADPCARENAAAIVASDADPNLIQALRRYGLAIEEELPAVRGLRAKLARLTFQHRSDNGE